LIHEERHDAELEPAAFDILDEISAPPLAVSSEAFTIGTFELETPRTRDPLTSATREPANLGTLKRLEQFLSAIHHARSELSAHPCRSRRRRSARDSRESVTTLPRSASTRCSSRIFRICST